MASGHPLDDDDRLPWLHRVGERIRVEEELGHAPVTACSALKRSYRDILREYDPDAFFVLLNGSIEVVRERLNDSASPVHARLAPRVPVRSARAAPARRIWITVDLAWAQTHRARDRRRARQGLTGYALLDGTRRRRAAERIHAREHLRRGAAATWRATACPPLLPLAMALEVCAASCKEAAGDGGEPARTMSAPALIAFAEAAGTPRWMALSAPAESESVTIQSPKSQLVSHIVVGNRRDAGGQ